VWAVGCESSEHDKAVVPHSKTHCAQVGVAVLGRDEEVKDRSVVPEIELTIRPPRQQAGVQPNNGRIIAKMPPRQELAGGKVTRLTEKQDESLVATLQRMAQDPNETS
jgi:hypothetical protein